MTSYTTIIRAILRDNEIEADAKAVFGEMIRHLSLSTINELNVPTFVEVCLESERMIRP